MARFVLIGGGALGEMHDINELIVKLSGVSGRKPYVLFFPQASAESKPYVNTFTREFRTRLKCKTSSALWKYGEMDREHIREKTEAADIIYIGGGRYDRLKEEFDKMGIRELLDAASARGAVIAGNSAGAMLLTERAISDCTIDEEGGGDYSQVDGYGFVRGTLLPHAEEKARINYIEAHDIACDYAIESRKCLIFER